MKSFFAKRLLGEVNDLIIKEKVKTIIDIGCGEGYPDSLLLARDPQLKIVGVDIDCRVIDVARKKNPMVKYKEGNIYNLAEAENGFDLALVLEVLEHLNNAQEAVKEVRRIAPRAIFSVSQEPLFFLASFVSGNYKKNINKHPDHVNFWNKDSFEKLLAKEYQKVEIKTVFPWIVAICQK